MNSHSEAPKKACATISVGQTFGFFLRSRNFSAGRDDLRLPIDRQRGHLDELRDGRGGISDVQLLHEERETLFERLADGLTVRFADAPHLILEGTDRLLAGLVDE